MPEWLKKMTEWELWEFIVYVGIPFALAGWMFQEALIRRRKLRREGIGLRRERRRADRPYRSRGDLDQQAEDLAAAIQAVASFLDGEARLTHARTCAVQVTALIKPHQRGEVTRRFLKKVTQTTDMTLLTDLALDMQDQMITDLRGITERMEREGVQFLPEAPPTPSRVTSKTVADAAPVVEPAAAAQAKPARPRTRQTAAVTAAARKAAARKPAARTTATRKPAVKKTATAKAARATASKPKAAPRRRPPAATTEEGATEESPA